VAWKTRFLDYDGEPSLMALKAQIQPNLPWADDHFAERVSRIPSNPGEAYRSWPWWHGQETYTAATLIQEAHDTGFQFDHTYQERFWPKNAGYGPPAQTADDLNPTWWHEGIRYRYGDLDDVIDQLIEYPTSRQAYFPIFFPEDTGNVHRGRIPCTLGYHFLMRNNRLHMWYTIRSCDLVRHFRDDLYLAARLQLWVLDELRNKADVGPGFHTIWDDIEPGLFHFHCFSLHVHKGDLHHVKS
jgi:hypothetical protein